MIWQENRAALSIPGNRTQNKSANLESACGKRCPATNPKRVSKRHLNPQDIRLTNPQFCKPSSTIHLSPPQAAKQPCLPPGASPPPRTPNKPSPSAPTPTKSPNPPSPPHPRTSTRPPLPSPPSPSPPTRPPPPLPPQHLHPQRPKKKQPRSPTPTRASLSACKATRNPTISTRKQESCRRSRYKRIGKPKKTSGKRHEVPFPLPHPPNSP